MIACLIFDLDGTLIDNREANARSYVEAFSDVGVRITVSDYNHHFGLRFPELAAKLAQNLSSEQLAIVRQQKAVHYKNNVGLIKPNHQLINFLRWVRPFYKTGLATTASRQNAEFVLDHFQLLPLFDVTVFGEDVKVSKPDPECYNICIKRCEVEPKQCLIFEDSAVGIQAAEATGSGVIKIPSDTNQGSIPIL